MSATLTPLVDLRDAGHACAEPRLALNRSAVRALGAALDKAEQKGEDEVTILVMSPNGRQSSLKIQRLDEISAEAVAELAMLNAN
jgi:hypothetical protein